MWQFPPVATSASDTFYHVTIPEKGSVETQLEYSIHEELMMVVQLKQQDCKWNEGTERIETD